MTMGIFQDASGFVLTTLCAVRGWDSWGSMALQCQNPGTSGEPLLTCWLDRAGPGVSAGDVSSLSRPSGGMWGPAPPSREAAQRKSSRLFSLCLFTFFKNSSRFALHRGGFFLLWHPPGHAWGRMEVGHPHTPLSHSDHTQSGREGSSVQDTAQHEVFRPAALSRRWRNLSGHSQDRSQRESEQEPGLPAADTVKARPPRGPQPRGLCGVAPTGVFQPEAHGVRLPRRPAPVGCAPFLVCFTG